ncbi:DUF2628 domain-containing protein [uncultured Exiguobacterium sp.]|uniref:DUF2628 domain-containing protein n=1 Tax=uncultured Exiguobacterium sp. TaxID=202669 RepID=UPI0025DB2699|nr:DUF2628 domain-containing protein [uncultured Exiguobacterium sp.]
MQGILQHPSGLVKEVKVGFSWTTFFFGFFPAFFRGDFKWGLIQLVLAIVAGTATVGFGTGLVSLVFSFIYNKIYINELIEKGYRPIDTSFQQALKHRGIHARLLSETPARQEAAF